MKKLSLLALIGALAACSDGGGSPKYSHYTTKRGDGYIPSTTVPYANFAASNNKKVTGMISRNAAQVEDYIAYRMGNWTPKDGDTAIDLNKLDIADLAVWLTSGDKDQAELEAKYTADKNLLNAALYVINRNLQKKCGDMDNAAASAKCIINWRNQYASQFDTSVKEMQQNAQLLTADNAPMQTSNDTTLTFSIDDKTGAISAITVANSDGTKPEFKRGENNMFYRFIEGTDDGNKYFANETLTYTSAGRDLGLSYSDFGTYSIFTHREELTETEDEKHDVLETNTGMGGVFAGGYDTKKIDTADIAQDMSFRGRAVGSVTSTKDGVPRSVSLDGSAALRFDKENATSTLSAIFGNWYDVTAVTNGTNTTVTFDGYPTDAENDMSLITAANENGKIVINDGKMSANYYGNNGTPSEATGMLQVTDCGGVPCTADTPYVKMDMAFGVKK